ncbi:MAG: DNA mismatch repair endonuclease MutL [Planctomycetota bacterium]
MSATETTSEVSPNAGSPEPRRTIRRLPPLLVNQIAAGEVIERPASVVKELVENAIDAGSTKISVELGVGGLDLVRVRDDGCGIPEGQLPLALAAHATSKVAEAADLDRIATLGFRGEAIASIASVARVRIRSRVAGSDAAFEIACEGGDESPIKPAAHPVGTTVEVRTLFFNTPARRKFVRTPNTEKARCMDWVRDLALAHPGIGFAVSHDGKPILDLPPNQTAGDRAVAVLGPELAPELLEVSVDRFDDARGILIWGLVGRPAIARPTAKAQHVFLNGRAVRDKTIQHAIREAYRGLIEPGRHPTALLMIEMAPDAVDVNVHPAKLEVRFRDQSMVHGAVTRGVRDALQRADLTRPVADTQLGAGRASTPRPPLELDFGPGTPQQHRLSADGRASAQAFAEHVRALRDEAERAVRPVVTAEELAPVVSDNSVLIENRSSASSGLSGSSFGSSSGASGEIEATPEASLPPAGSRSRFTQIHDSYIVVEDEQGMLIIDQHALHERVMFETLSARLGLGFENGSKSLESQRFLTPATADVEPEVLAGLDGVASLLARLGIEAAALGPRSLGVHAFPTLLIERKVEPGAFVSELLAKAHSEPLPPNEEAALHEVLDMMSCKAAVKAGDRLSEGEIEALLAQRHLVERSAACPHGRPTSVRVSLTQLERLFERR